MTAHEANVDPSELTAPEFSIYDYQISGTIEMTGDEEDGGQFFDYEINGPDGPIDSGASTYCEDINDAKRQVAEIINDYTQGW